MGFSKYCVLVAATTVLIVTLVNQADAKLLSGEISKQLPGIKINLVDNDRIDKDREIVVAMSDASVKEIDDITNKYMIPGKMGEPIRIITGGLKKSLKIIGKTFSKVLEVLDELMSKNMEDKHAGYNLLFDILEEMREGCLKSGLPFHSSLGAAKSMGNITDKLGFQDGITHIQECGTELFDNIDAMEALLSQCIETDDFEILKTCLQAAHAAFKSAAETANIYFVRSARTFCEYLSTSDEASIIKHEPMDDLVSDKARQAAAADLDTVVALKNINAEFDLAINLGINASILSDMKLGLVDYADYCALGMAVCYEVFDTIHDLAVNNPKEAQQVLIDIFELAKKLMIRGSVKAYEALGAAARATGVTDIFNEPIHHCEKGRIKGTKGLDAAKTIALRAVMTGGNALPHGLNAAQKILRAVEDINYFYIHATMDSALNKLRPGVIHHEH